MEGFTSLLQYTIGQNVDFVLHPNFRSLNITHLIFAYGLFVLSGGEFKSSQLIADALSDFHLFYGLKPNIQKSSIFFSGVDDATKVCLGSILPTPEGSLPVKYLGVPLISSRLKAADCFQETEKILGRIQS